MDDHRQAEVHRQLPLLAHHALLGLAGRVVVEEVEAALAHRDDLGMLQRIRRLARCRPSSTSRRGADALPPSTRRRRSPRIVRSGAARRRARCTARGSPAGLGRAPSPEPRPVRRIRGSGGGSGSQCTRLCRRHCWRRWPRWLCGPWPTQRTVVPGGTSRSGCSRTGLPSSDAANTMPFDSMPISFAGFRLATTTTSLPTRSSAS